MRVKRRIGEAPGRAASHDVGSAIGASLPASIPPPRGGRGDVDIASAGAHADMTMTR
jgi:hypothetical protein